LANSVKLLNYLDPQDNYLRFYTELDSDFEVGDKVFIIGGNYDNTFYTDKTHNGFNPFHQYAAGYVILDVDQTTVSNAITLNIKFSDATFNSGGIQTLIFDPKPVYKTEIELLLEPNQVREAYISKTYFKRGEFNGGKFQDGIFGEYNIKGTHDSNKVYQRQHFVDLLRATSVVANDIVTVNAIDAYDYTTLETPVNNNRTKFNNNFDNTPAEWTGGIFLGGDFQWGEWKSKNSDTKSGKLQKLNDDFGIKNILDNSKYDIETFTDNNNGVGYNQFISGNFARIYSGNLEIDFDVINKEIIFTTVPYVISKAFENGFDIQLKIKSSIKNSRIFDVVYNGSNALVLSEYQIFDNDFTLEQELYSETQAFHDIEIYAKDKVGKPVRFSTGRVLSADWFGGVFEKGSFEGGDWYWGEFKTGTISTSYQTSNWWDGVFNGSVDESYAENLRWYNGNWVNGNWKGDSKISVESIIYDNSGYIKIDVHTRYKHLFKIGEKTFLSYFKKGITNSYLENYTDVINDYVINFQTFNLIDIIEDSANKALFKVTLLLQGNLNPSILKDINLQYAKVSQSHFKKGIWRNGIWESGLREVQNYKITDFDAGTNFLPNKQMQLTINTIDNLKVGDKIEITNFNLVRDIDIEYLEDVVSTNDNRLDQEYFQSLDLTLTVINITSGTAGNNVIVRFPINSTTGDIDLPEISKDNLAWFTDDGLKRIDLINIENGKTELATCLWMNGEFRSGAWRGGLWKNGILSNLLYFDNVNTQIQSVWQSGYWKNGTFTNGAFLSGVWQTGVWKNGIMTNLFENDDINSENIYSDGDSVWIDGIFENGTWRRGLFLEGKFLNGTIINGGINSIEWTKGQYTNGFGEYVKTNNINKTGRFIDSKNEYDTLSAPSLIYIDRDGWTQLDQPSFYQKGYNIIFQDLDLHGNNPFNNQMFSVQNRDMYGSKLKIVDSTSGDNPLLNSLSLPIIATDNIVDIVEMGTSGNIWIADSGNKRILEVNQNTGLVDVLGKVIGDSIKDKFDFSNIKFMFKGTAFVYVVDGSTVKLINEDKDIIITQTPGLALGEEIVDMWVASQNQVLNEVVYLLTNLGKIYYWVPMWSSFKSLIALSYTVDVPVSFVGVRPDQSSRTHLLLNTLNNGISKLKYAVLDYSFSNLTYTMTSIVDTVITFKNDTVEGTDINKIEKVTASYVSGKFNVWLLSSKYDSSVQNIYRAPYDFTLNLFDFDAEKLNSNELDYPVDRFRLGLNSEHLTIIGKKDTYNVFFSKAKIAKSEFGLGNPSSTIKLFDIHQNLTDNVKYWIYDDEPKSKRILYITEGNDPENFYNSELSDTIESDVDVIQLIPGESTNIVYAIIKRSTVTSEEYKIRKVDNSKIDSENSIENDTTFTFSSIYDGVFIKDTLYIIANDGSGVKVFNVDTNLVVSLTTFSTSFSVFTGTGFRMHGVEDGSDIILMIYEKGINKVWEARVNSIITNIFFLSSTLNGVIDIAVAKSPSYVHLYLAYANKVVMSISDKSVAGHYSWTENIKDIVYNGSGIEEIVKTEFNKIVVKYGIDFDIFDIDYTSTDKTIEEAVLNGTNFWAISNNTILKVNNSSTGADTYEVLQGKYRQISRPHVFAASVNNNDNVLGKPKSIIHAPSFGGGSYIYFIDEFSGSSSYNIIRRINTSTNATSIENFGSDKTKYILDLSYDIANNRLYVLYRSGSDTKIGYLSTVDGSITNGNTFVANTTIRKISVMNDSGTIYVAMLYVLLDGTSQIIIYNTFYSIFNTLNIPSIVSDISFIINNSSISNKYQIFFVNADKNLNLFSNNALTGTWTKKSMGLSVNTINEKLDTNDLIYVDGSQTINYIKTTGDTSEDRLSVKDMAFYKLVSPESIFFYNLPQIGSSGITRESIPSNLSDGIDLSLTTQIDNDISVNSSSFKKMVAISSDVVYAMFDNSIYEYNFNAVSLTNLVAPVLEYRNSLDQTPVGINSIYHHKAIDIAVVNGDLITIFEIVDTLNNGTGKYNIFRYIGTDFVNIDYLYYSLTESIAEDGGTNGEVFPMGTGGIKYLFNSVIEPKIAGKTETTDSDTSESIYIYMKESISSSEIFLKVIQKVGIDIIQNSQFADLVFLLNIPGFDSSIETLTTAYITPNPLGGSTPLASTSFVNVYDSVPVSDTQKMYVIFEKPIGQLFQIDTNYTISVKFDSNIATNPPSYTDVYDFRVYKNNSSDELLIRENGTNFPINTVIDVLNNGFWELVRTQEGKWVVDNMDAIISPTLTDGDDLEIRSLIKASNFTVIELDIVITNNNTIQLDLLILPALDKSYHFDSFNGIDRGYKVINTRGNQVLSPYVTGRVLFETIVNTDVSFNANGTAESGHVVSTRWKNGLFIGSWDAPRYLNYNIITKYSVFISGIFEGKFYDGFFLGGTFRNPVNSESILLQGHFMSDGANINWESGKVQSDYRYDIHNIKWDDVNNGILKVLVQGLTYDGDDYIPQTPTQIASGSLVQIPTLFKKNEIAIEKITRGKISIVSGKDEIILKVLAPEYYDEKLWVNNNIFISSSNYTEYLFGEFIVNHSYVSDGFLYLIINSKFNAFDVNGEYEPLIKPKLLIAFYNKIISKTDYTDGFTEFEIALPVPSNIINTLNTYSDKLRLVKSYYINDNIDVLLYGNFVGDFIIPNYLQMFAFTFNKTYNDVILRFNSKATNLYLNNIISDNNTSYVSVDLNTSSASLFAIDVMVKNSYLTSSNVNNWIEESIFLSGKTDRRWVSGAWLNIDDKGFSNGKSQFGDSTIMPLFDGEPTKVIDIAFESREYIWIQLENLIQNVDKHRYITLRGFTGNKSNLIGSTRSKVFRIEEVDSYWIKIKNPFKYYYGLNSTNSSPYLKDFNVDELQIQKQTMSLKALTTSSIDAKIDTGGTNFIFEYGWASVSSWNGGDFYGDFNSIWNAGNFRDGNFNGKWFGSPESSNWQGEIQLNRDDLGNKFLLTIRGLNGIVREKDLIYIKFNSIFNNIELVDVLEGFYSDVQYDGTSGNLIAEYTTNIYLEEGNYPVNITRYRVDYKNSDVYTLEDNTLIVDYNVNLASTNDVNMHTLMDKNIGATSGGLVINFNGDNSIATGDLVDLALNTGSVGEMTVDLAFKYNTLLEGDRSSIFGFHNTETVQRTGFKLYIKKDGGIDKIYLEYQKDKGAVTIELEHGGLTSGTWNNISLFVNNSTASSSLKYIVNSYYNTKDISTWDSFVDNVNYDLNLIGQCVFGLSNNIVSNFLIGQLDEIRIWNKDMYDYFLSPHLFQNKRFINGYIPQIVAYFSGENYDIDNAKYYPKEENYFAFDNEFKKVDTLSFTKVNNAIYEFDMLTQSRNGAFKIIAIEEERFVESGVSGFKYIVELFGIDNDASSSGRKGTFSFKYKETIVSGNNVVAGRENYYSIPCEIEYWKWHNVIITENGIYINGIVIPESKISFRNRDIFKQTVKVRVSLGDSSYSPTSKYDTVAALYVNGVQPTYLRGFIKNVNIFENNNTKEDYIIYRIISPEDITNFSVSESFGTSGNRIISNNISASTSSLIEIPYFNNDGSMSWEHYIYTTENYYKSSVSGDEIIYNKDIRDSGSIISSDFDDSLRFIDTDKISTALPSSTWLEGTDFITVGNMLDDFSTVLTISNMSNFELFGKKFADTSGNAKMRISTNGIMTLVDDPLIATQNYFNAYSMNDVPFVDYRYKYISSIDIIYMLFTDLYPPATGSKWEIADREDEVILRYYVTLYNDSYNSTVVNGVVRNSGSTPPYPTIQSNFNYFAIRLDKINSNILFYNRRIKNDPSHQKIQGIRRSDATWNYVNDLNRFRYYKYKNTDNDYIVGYDDSILNVNHPSTNTNSKIVYESKNTEYILYVPRIVTHDDNNFIGKIITKDYDYLTSNLNIKLITSYNNSKVGSVMYDYVYDSARIINDYYIINTVEGNEGTDFIQYGSTSFIPLSYTFSEQFNLNQSDINVSRNSFFYGGKFNSKVWYNGILVSGNINLDGITSSIWKYGIKHNGSISSDKLLPVYTHLHWLGGFHIGNPTSIVKNIIWYRGYWRGGVWNGGNWLSLSLNNQYTSDDWSVWNKGEWYSKFNFRVVRVATTIAFATGLPIIDGVLVKEGDKVLIKNNGMYTASAIKWIKDASITDYTNTVVFVSEGIIEKSNTYIFTKPTITTLYTTHYNPSIWHGGTWNSDLIGDKEFTYQSNEYKFYNLNDGKQIELPVVNSIWLGGEWLRGVWNGGIFANGTWHSASAATSGLIGYEIDLGYKYHKSFSLWNSGMMINSIWEGGVVNSNTSNLETVFGDITNFDIITPGSDFVWDSTKFKFKLSNNSTTILGKKVFDFNKDTLTVSNSKNRVLSQFNNDGILSVYWKRGEWSNGIFQFSYWDNKSINNVDLGIISESGNESMFDNGCFYSSYWKGGLWNNRSSNNTTNSSTIIPNSLFYRSQWEKGYWKADGLTGTTDNIEITDGIFSRSVWNAGVWEGGLFDLSVWRSGVSSNTNLTYKGTTLALTTTITGKNYTFAVNHANIPTTMIGDPTTLTYNNDSTFITNIDNIISTKSLRYLGGVDNLASVWVNGWMRGSVWHGGVWQRGMFSHKEITSIDSFDFFDDGENNKISLGVWVRGLWLSGYFSYYNDKNVIGQSPSYGTTYEYLNETNGHRCLFMGIKANAYTSEGDWDLDNMFGISKAKLDFELSSVNLAINNIASLFGKAMIKSGSTRYFSIFNGTFVNGALFDDNTNVNDSNRPVLSIFASIGKYFYKNNTTGEISIDGVSDKFVNEIKVTKTDKLMSLFIPYDLSYPIYNDGGVWKNITSTNASVLTYLNSFYNGHYAVSSVDWVKSIWRHNHSIIGDGGTIPSILQGVGYKWNPTQTNVGEPNYSDFTSLELTIYRP